MASTSLAERPAVTLPSAVVGQAGFVLLSQIDAMMPPVVPGFPRYSRADCATTASFEKFNIIFSDFWSDCTLAVNCPEPVVRIDGTSLYPFSEETLVTTGRPLLNVTVTANEPVLLYQP